MDLTLDDILRSPRAQLLADALQARLADEAQRRERFIREKNEKQKSEWLNGEVVVHSPVKLEHGDVNGRIYSLLSAIARVQRLGLVGIEKFQVRLSRNDPEPDICFWRQEVAASFTRKQMLFPAPDLVVEVLSPGTEHNDRVLKFEDYAIHGVREYWIVDPDSEVIEQYVLSPERAYRLVAKAHNSTLASPVLLATIPVRACFDDAENVAAMRQVLG